MRLIFEGKGTNVTIQGAMYVPGIVYTLVAERDMGEAGFDICKRNMVELFSLKNQEKLLANMLALVIITGAFTSSRITRF